MAINFNIVQKPKEEDEEEKDELLDEDELELEEDDNSSSNNKGMDPKKKLYRLMGIIVVVFIVFLLIIFVASLASNGSRSYSYSDIEKVMKNAAISYFKDNPDLLPEEEGDVIEIDSSNLTAAEKMKDLSEYLKEGDACSGTVQVEKTASGYLYTPYLNCGDNYSTVELANKILENEEIVTSGYGLYSTKAGHVFRGENVNNYVQLDKALWRIVKITSNNNIMLISADVVGSSTSWDNRYNPDKKYESGINIYANSRVRESLDKIYANPEERRNELILSNKDKKKLVSFNLCTGKRLINNDTKDNSVECSEVLKDQEYGLLTLSDFMYASVDENCKIASDRSCKNYNYLVIRKDWWLVTANAADTSTVYKVSGNGVVKGEDGCYYAYIRPVIYLNSKTLYKSGNGTLEKPYKVR